MVGIYHAHYKVLPATGFPHGFKRPLFYQARCKSCDYQSGKRGHPNQAERSVVDHLLQKHGITIEKENP